jgi:hypothetical protein
MPARDIIKGMEAARDRARRRVEIHRIEYEAALADVVDWNTRIARTKRRRKRQRRGAS